MRSTYRWLAYLVAIGVVMQAMAIALGVFTIWKDVDAGAVVDKDYAGNAGMLIHSTLGTGVIPLLAIALLVVSFLAPVPHGLRWAAAVFGLVALQVLLAILAFSAPVVGAFHGLNALALFGVALVAGRRARVATPVDSGEPPARSPAAA